MVHKAPSDDSNNLNPVVNRVETFEGQSDPVEQPADPYAQYRTLQSETPLALYASNGNVDLPTVQLLRDMGNTGDANSDALLRLASLDRTNKFDFANPTDADIDNIARNFKVSPAEAREFMRRAHAEFLVEKLKALTEPISTAEQEARLTAASQEVSQASTKITAGSADAGDLAELLAAYSKLGGFPKGVLAQGAVGQMMDRIRLVLGAVYEGRALGNFDYASIIHDRKSKYDMQHEYSERMRKRQV